MCHSAHFTLLLVVCHCLREGKREREREGERERERKREKERERERERERDREREERERETKRETEREKERERCARLNGGHLTRCRAHTTDICARPMSPNSNARWEVDLKIALMPPSREWTYNQISIVQHGRRLNQPSTRKRQGADSANMHKLDHFAAIEVFTYFKEHASRHTVLPTLSETSKISDPIDLHEMPAVQAPHFYPARDGGEDTVNEQGDAEKRSTTTTRPGLQHGGPRRAEPTEQGTEQRGRRTSQSHPARSGRCEKTAGHQCHRR